MLALRCPACGGGAFAGGGVDGLVCQGCGSRSTLGANGILELLAAETSGCATPKVKTVRPKRPPRPARARLPKAIPAAPIPAAPTPVRAPTPPPVPPQAKKDPVPALGLRRSVPIAPQRGPWRVVDAQGVVLAEGPDRRRAEELAEILGGSVVPVGQP